MVFISFVVEISVLYSCHYYVPTWPSAADFCFGLSNTVAGSKSEKVLFDVIDQTRIVWGAHEACGLGLSERGLNRGFDR